MNKKTKKIASVVLGIALTSATLVSCSGSNKSLKSSCASMSKGTCSANGNCGSMEKK